jgi:AraC-like DNA-binding protein
MGVTPKLYAEIVRLEGLLDRFIDTIMKVGADGGPRESWGALAADAGYYDQSHLTRAFHRFVGMTPGAFAARVGEGGPESVRFLPEGEDWDRRPRPSTRDGPSG